MTPELQHGSVDVEVKSQVVALCMISPVYGEGLVRWVRSTKGSEEAERGYREIGGDFGAYKNAPFRAR